VSSQSTTEPTDHPKHTSYHPKEPYSELIEHHRAYTTEPATGHYMST